MTVYTEIRKGFDASKKNLNREIISSYRVILSELSRLDTKDPSDKEVLSVIKKLYKNEKGMQEYHGRETSDYLEILERYMPKMMTKEEIKDYILTNIDITIFKNKMQAMKPIMQALGNKVDGNIVKELLNEM